MKRLNVPPFLNDLYRDLRDRRLLVPVLLLLAGLVAVPVVLSHPGEATPPPAPPAASGPAAATEPAVLVDQPLGVRDYRERLERFKAKNPFKQQFPLRPVESSADVDVTDTNLSADPSSDTTSGGVPSLGSAAGGAVSTASPPTTGSSDSGSSPQPPKPETRFYAFRVDVSVGPEGSLAARNGVQVLTPLPSRNKPVVVLLGVTENGGHAVFAVSRDVIAVDGTGTCIPGPANCAYVSVGAGEYATFDYAPDATTYRVNVRDIRKVRINEPNGRLKAGLGKTG